MESIAVTKPNMAVLGNRPAASPFGLLACAFAEELLAQHRGEEGFWPYVPLDFLEEDGGEPGAASAPERLIRLNVSLNLELLRREKALTEREKTTERILERVLRVQARQEKARQSAARKRESTPRTGPRSPQALSVQENHYHTLKQNYTVTVNRWQAGPPVLSRPSAEMPGGAQPGERTVRFSQQLRAWREEGRPAPQAPETAAEASGERKAGGQSVPTPASAAEHPAGEAKRKEADALHRILPPESLTHRTEEGETSIPEARRVMETRAAELAAKQLSKELTALTETVRREETADRRASQRVSSAEGKHETENRRTETASAPRQGERERAVSGRDDRGGAETARREASPTAAAPEGGGVAERTAAGTAPAEREARDTASYADGRTASEETVKRETARAQTEGRSERSGTAAPDEKRAEAPAEKQTAAYPEKQTAETAAPTVKQGETPSAQTAVAVKNDSNREGPASGKELPGREEKQTSLSAPTQTAAGTEFAADLTERAAMRSVRTAEELRTARDIRTGGELSPTLTPETAEEAGSSSLSDLMAYPPQELTDRVETPAEQGAQSTVSHAEGQRAPEATAKRETAPVQAERPSEKTGTAASAERRTTVYPEKQTAGTTVPTVRQGETPSARTAAGTMPAADLTKEAADHAADRTKGTTESAVGPTKETATSAAASAKSEAAFPDDLAEGAAMRPVRTAAELRTARDIRTGGEFSPTLTPDAAEEAGSSPLSDLLAYPPQELTDRVEAPAEQGAQNTASRTEGQRAPETAAKRETAPAQTERPSEKTGTAASAERRTAAYAETQTTTLAEKRTAEAARPTVRQGEAPSPQTTAYRNDSNREVPASGKELPGRGEKQTSLSTQTQTAGGTTTAADLTKETAGRTAGRTRGTAESSVTPAKEAAESDVSRTKGTTEPAVGLTKEAETPATPAKGMAALSPDSAEETAMSPIGSAKGKPASPADLAEGAAASLTRTAAELRTARDIRTGGEFSPALTPETAEEIGSSPLSDLLAYPPQELTDRAEPTAEQGAQSAASRTEGRTAPEAAARRETAPAQTERRSDRTGTAAHAERQTTPSAERRTAAYTETRRTPPAERTAGPARPTEKSGESLSAQTAIYQNDSNREAPVSGKETPGREGNTSSLSAPTQTAGGMTPAANLTKGTTAPAADQMKEAAVPTATRTKGETEPAAPAKGAATPSPDSAEETAMSSIGSPKGKPASPVDLAEGAAGSPARTAAELRTARDIRMGGEFSPALTPETAEEVGSSPLSDLLAYPPQELTDRAEPTAEQGTQSAVSRTEGQTASEAKTKRETAPLQTERHSERTGTAAHREGQNVSSAERRTAMDREPQTTPPAGMRTAGPARPTAEHGTPPVQAKTDSITSNREAPVSGKEIPGRGEKQTSLSTSTQTAAGTAPSGSPAKVGAAPSPGTAEGKTTPSAESKPGEVPSITPLTEGAVLSSARLAERAAMLSAQTARLAAELQTARDIRTGGALSPALTPEAAEGSSPLSDLLAYPPQELTDRTEPTPESGPQGASARPAAAGDRPQTSGKSGSAAGTEQSTETFRPSRPTAEAGTAPDAGSSTGREKSAASSQAKEASPRAGEPTRREDRPGEPIAEQARKTAGPSPLLSRMPGQAGRFSPASMTALQGRPMGILNRSASPAGAIYPSPLSVRQGVWGGEATLLHRENGEAPQMGRQSVSGESGRTGARSPSARMTAGQSSSGSPSPASAAGESGETEAQSPSARMTAGQNDLNSHPIPSAARGHRPGETISPMAVLSPMTAGAENTAAMDTQTFLPPYGFPPGEAEMEYRTAPEFRPTASESGTSARSGEQIPGASSVRTPGTPAAHPPAGTDYPKPSAAPHLPLGELSYLRQSGQEMTDPAAGSLPTALRQSPAGGAFPQKPMGAAGPEPGTALPAGEFSAPVEMAFPTPPPPPAAEQETAGASPMDSEYVRSLPDWAQRFLKREPGASIAGTRPMQTTAGALSAPLPNGGEEQVRWTAPGYRPPETLSFREKSGEKPAEKRTEEPRFSDAEIRRMSDQVYRIIEDRIRWERRRLGL